MFVIENVDIFTLASICKEYQVDWLIKKIENYLQENIPREIAKTTEQILHYLKLASQMCFDKVERMLLQRLDQPFDVIQAKDEFNLLNRRAKILVARKCLWDISINNSTSINNLTSITYLFMEKETRRILMNTEEFGLLSILKDFKQKPIEMDQQSKKSAGLDNIRRIQSTEQASKDFGGQKMFMGYQHK